MILSSHHKEVLLWSGGVLLTVVAILALTISLDQMPGMDVSHREAASIAPTGGLQSATNQHPAGLPGAKGQTLMGVPKGAAQTEKGSGSMKIEIVSVGRSNLTPGAPLELEATVEALADLKNLEFAWHLPEGVSVETGTTQGLLGNLADGQKKTVRLTLLLSAETQKLVHLSIFRRNGSESSGNVAQFSIDSQRAPAAAASALTIGTEKTLDAKSAEAFAAAHLVQ
jgi:hypothetical protein